MNRPPAPSHYRVLDLLGRGGTAEVYRASAELLNREVALKLPLPVSDDHTDIPFAALVDRENRLIGRRTFPGLVRILDSSRTAPEYVAMEVCSGPTLETLGRIENVSVALNLLSAMALDLEYLRAAGIVHGDFKPHNVFLPPDWQELTDDRLFYAKLSDFSLGRLIGEPDDDRAGLGTVGYLAPEIITHGTASHRSDLFALGVTAYQMLTGVHPFMDGDTDAVKINSRCREEEPRPVADLRPDVGSEVSALIDRLLAKDPQGRPESGWAVCQELSRHGARYPFERAIQPKHFVHREASYKAAVESLPIDVGDHADRLQLLTGDSVARLRLVLGENFRRGNLVYNGSQFVFAQLPVWPHRLRRERLRAFLTAQPQTQRALLRAAVAGSLAAYDKLNRPDGILLDAKDDAVLALLLPLLKTATVRRLAAGLAAQAEQQDQLELAARLYVMAGNLEKAELCSFQAATLLAGDHESRRALRLINAVVDYARLTDRLFDVRSLLRIRADLFKETDELAATLDAYREIIGLYDSRPADVLLAETYNGLGDLHKAMQRFDAGVEALQAARKIQEGLGHDVDVSKTLHSLGNIYWAAGDFATSLRYFRQALRIKHRLRQTIEVAKTLNNISVIFASVGRLGRSIKVQELSLKIKRESGDMAVIASSLNNLGYCHHLMGAQSEAISCLTEALDLNRKVGNKLELLINLESLSAVMIAAGRLKASVQYIREGAELSQAIGDKPHAGQFGLSLATVQRRMGRLGESQRQLQKLHSLLTEFDDKILTVKTLTADASLRLAVGDHESAVATVRKAVDMAEELGAKPEQLDALLLLSRITPDAEVLSVARALATELGLNRESQLIAANELEHLAAGGDIAAADGLLESVVAVISAGAEDIELARMCNLVADVLLQRNERDRAFDLLTKAHRLASNSGLAPEKVTALVLQGRIFADRGEHERSYAGYKEALTLVKAMSDDLTEPADRQMFQRTPTVGFLVQEIKRLGARLSAKK